MSNKEGATCSAKKEQEVGFFVYRIPFFAQMAIGVAIFATAYQWVDNHDIKLKGLDSIEARLGLAFRCLAFSITPVIYALLSVSIGRFTSPACDPSSGNEQVIALSQRILVNTFEQFVLHAFVLVSYSTILTESTAKFVPFLSAIFVLGRVLFIIGYRIHTKGRVLGFVLTLMPTLYTLAGVLSYLAKGGIQGLAVFSKQTAHHH